MAVHTDGFSLVGLTQPAKAIDNIRIDIEEGMPTRVAVEGMFDQALGCLHVHAECLCGLLGFHQYARGRAIRQLRRVAGGHVLVGTAHRRQLGQRLERGARAVARVGDRRHFPGRVPCCNSQPIKNTKIPAADSNSDCFKFRRSSAMLPAMAMGRMISPASCSKRARP